LPPRRRVAEVLANRPGQHFKDIAHPYGVVNPVADADVVNLDVYELIGRKLARIGGRVDLVEVDPAGVDDQVGALDGLEHVVG